LRFVSSPILFLPAPRRGLQERVARIHLRLRQTYIINPISAVEAEEGVLSDVLFLSDCCDRCESTDRERLLTKEGMSFHWNERGEMTVDGER
jgi:hypothetical protein